MFITGTFNKASKDEVTELPNVSDIVNMEIELNGERFSMNENNIKEYSRTLNLYTGAVSYTHLDVYKRQDGE